MGMDLVCMEYQIIRDDKISSVYQGIRTRVVRTPPCWSIKVQKKDRVISPVFLIFYNYYYLGAYIL